MSVISRRNGSRVRKGSSDAALAEFQAFIDTRLGPLEQSAAITAGEIGIEAQRIRGELKGNGRDAERIDGLAERLAHSTATFAEDVARLRVALASRGPAATNGSPSEGVALLVSQMSVAGAPADEIEARLADLGVERPREVVKRLLPG